MKDIRDFMIRNRQFFAFVFVLLVISLALYAFQKQHDDSLKQTQDQATEKFYQAALASCERGNTIREVVYANTVAIKKVTTDFIPGHPAVVDKQLEVLRAAPYVDLKDGTVDCKKAVNEPRPEDS